MTASTFGAESTRTIGLRIAHARAAKGFTQEELSKNLGLAGHQILSSIEKGERRVKAYELVKLCEKLGRPMERFLDPFVISGEGKFSWRVCGPLSNEELAAFEESSGNWLGLLRFLRSVSGNLPGVLTKTLEVDERTTFEEASIMGEEVARTLGLGIKPSERLIEQIEQQLDIPVLYFDGGRASKGISGAICRMRNLRAILINRHEPPERRAFDVAHELFHALTWDMLTPKHRENSVSEKKSEARGGTKSKAERIKRLADNFADGLLMPRHALSRIVDQNRLSDLDHLTDVAQLLQVSHASLAYRLFNMQQIDLETRDKLIAKRNEHPVGNEPKLFSSGFIRLVNEGIESGHVSARKAAISLGLTLSELSLLIKEYDLYPSFSF